MDVDFGDFKCLCLTVAFHGLVKCGKVKEPQTLPWKMMVPNTFTLVFDVFSGTKSKNLIKN